MILTSLKIHDFNHFGEGKLKAVKAGDLHKFLSEQDKAKTGTVAFVDCQSDGQNQKVKFSGAYQIRTNDMNDARVCFQPGGKANPARIEKADLVIIYCEQASARSPAAMKSYEKYLTSKGKKQDVVLLEGGIAAYKALFPNDKIEPWTNISYANPIGGKATSTGQAVKPQQ